MKKVGIVLAVLVVVAIIVGVVIGFGRGKEANDQKPIVQKEDKIKINEVQDYAMAKLMAESKMIEKEDLPEELKKLAKVGGLDASLIQIYYTKSDVSSEEFDVLHDYVLLYFDDVSNKSIKISCSNLDKPLRDYFFQAVSEDISSLEGFECKISKYEERYIINFEKDGYKYDVETSGLSESEMINLIKEIAKDVANTIPDEIPTTVAYANWIDDEVAFESDEKCLNVDKYVFSDYPRLPTFKFDTKSELDEFKNKYKDVFAMDQSYNEVDSFNEVIANYDDDFFNTHSLVLTYKRASSGSFRFAITEVKKANGTLTLIVERLNNPEVYTTDMAGWILMAEVEKDYIKDCSSFDTQDWEGFSR